MLRKQPGEVYALKVTTMPCKATVLIEKDKHGYSPEPAGCQTQGDRLGRVLSRMKKAVALYPEDFGEAQCSQYPGF